MVWNPLKRFGVWTTLLSWNEPAAYRARLRGDVLVRLGVALAVGSVCTAGLLILFAINVNPPPAAAALFAMLIGGGLTACLLLFGGENNGGRVRICEEGVVRLRTHSVSFMGMRNMEELCYNYSAVSQATIVPGAAIGKSFSLLFLSTPGQWELFGVPGRVSPEQLATTLAGRGVNVQFADHVPPSLRQPMSWSVAVVPLTIALPLLGAGFVFYVMRVPAAGGNVAAVVRRHPMPRPDPAKLPPGRMIGPRVDRRQQQGDAPAAAGAPDEKAKEAAQGGGPGIAGFPPLPGRGAGQVGFGQGGFRGGAGGPPGFRGRAGFGGPPRFGGAAGFDRPPGVKGAQDNEPVAGGQPANSPPITEDKFPTAADVAKAAGAALQPKKEKPTKPEYVPPRNQPGEPTELAGGPEGWQFQMVDKNRRTVVGFRYRMGSWGQQKAVAQFDPLYDREPPRGRGDVLMAREGYVVGGLQVVAGDLVNAVRVIFVREESDGSLNKGDHYFSDWIGDPKDKTPQVLGDGRRRVIGVCGRNGTVKNALALVLDEP